MAGHAAHFAALDEEAQRARDSTELQELLGRVVEVENRSGRRTKPWASPRSSSTTH